MSLLKSTLNWVLLRFTFAGSNLEQRKTPLRISSGVTAVYGYEYTSSSTISSNTSSLLRAFSLFLF